jgi:large subunit ribosomal protein L29
MAKRTLDDLSSEELLGRLAQAKDDLFKLRFQHATGQLTNYKRLGQLRREVARIMTRLRDLEIAEADALARSASGGRSTAATGQEAR